MAIRTNDGASDGAWDTAGNWDVVPGDGDDAVFSPDPANKMTTGPSAPISLATLTVGSAAWNGPNLSNLTVTGATTMTCVRPAGINTWTNGTFNGNFASTHNPIASGTFNGTVTVDAPVTDTAVTGGTFAGDFIALGDGGVDIEGGTFTGWVHCRSEGAIGGGDFSGCSGIHWVRGNAIIDAYPLDFSGVDLYLHSAIIIDDTGGAGLTWDSLTAIHLMTPTATVAAGGTTVSGGALPTIDCALMKWGNVGRAFIR